MSGETAWPDATLDFTALDAFLKARIPDLRGAPRVTPAAGGQSNPTFFIDYDACAMVLRTRPPGVLAASAHAIDREYRVLEALAPTSVPTPMPIVYEPDPSILGRPFYLMEKVVGLVCYDAALAAVPRERRRGLYLGMAQSLGALHGVDWVAADLADYGRPDRYFERQLARWSRVWAEQGLGDNEDLDAVVAWLSDNLIVSEVAAISHGDFRIANLVFKPQLDGIAAVLDWELSTIGHPLADLGFSCLGYHSQPSENGGLLGLDLPALGIPSQSEFLDAYYASAPAAGRLEPFHLIFALFRASMGAETIASRAAAGQGLDEGSLTFGRRMGAAYAKRARDLIAGVGARAGGS